MPEIWKQSGMKVKLSFSEEMASKGMVEDPRDAGVCVFISQFGGWVHKNISNSSGGKLTH